MTVRRVPTSLYTPNDSIVRSCRAVDGAGEVATGVIQDIRNPGIAHPRRSTR
jgi:hypothetical protein